MMRSRTSLHITSSHWLATSHAPPREHAYKKHLHQVPRLQVASGKTACARQCSRSSNRNELPARRWMPCTLEANGPHPAQPSQPRGRGGHRLRTESNPKGRDGGRGLTKRRCFTVHPQPHEFKAWCFCVYVIWWHLVASYPTPLQLPTPRKGITAA